MKITKKSMLTGKEHTMDLPVTEEELKRWKDTNAKIQHVFPHLSDSEREFLMTGATDEEWNNAFPDE